MTSSAASSPQRDQKKGDKRRGAGGTETVVRFFGGAVESGGVCLAKGICRHKFRVMSTVELIASEVRELEPKQQSQVLRFLQGLRQKKEGNEDRKSPLGSSARSMEDEPDFYGENASDSVPLLCSRDWKGKKMGAEVALSREVIAAAVRADRDAR